ncbi:MFS transporter, partial [Klebsiella pneumoniae]|uniref:MFS transporter n=1 Tax=Klebsiella pneumoniae TaxID=573 RepID=UPI0037BF86E9
EGDALWLSTIAAGAVIAITPLCGALSDRVGRRPVLLGLTVLAALLPLSLFAWMAQATPLGIALAAVLLACVAGGVSAVAAPATAEQFPGEGRVSGLALGVTMATAFFGGATPWLAQWWVERSGWAAAPGAMIALVAVLVLPVPGRAKR